MTQSSGSVETEWEVTLETDRSNLGGSGDQPASDFDEELSSVGQSFTQLSLGSRPGLHTRGPIPSSNKPMRPKDGLTALPRLPRLAPMFTLFSQVKGFQFDLSISAQPSWSVPITFAIALLLIAVVTIYISKKEKEVKRVTVNEFESDFCFTCETVVLMGRSSAQQRQHLFLSSSCASNEEDENRRFFVPPRTIRESPRAAAPITEQVRLRQVYLLRRRCSRSPRKVLQEEAKVHLRQVYILRRRSSRPSWKALQEETESVQSSQNKQETLLWPIQ
jgi:hypothetical protein